MPTKRTAMLRKSKARKTGSRQQRKAMQKHIMARAGTWDGYCSGEELLQDVTQLRKDMDAAQDQLTQLAREFDFLRERERLEREKYLLQLENAILRLERRLPAPSPPKEED